VESYIRAVETAARIVTHRLWVSSRRYLDGDGMSIVPSPGQMGPGTGGIGSVGAVLMKHPTLFKGLGMGPALTGLGTVLYLGDLSSARHKGFGNDVQEYRRTMSDKVYAQLIIPATSLLVRAHHELASTPPGGGGPGESPISTVAPPSIEETGEILSNPPMVGQESISRVSGAKFSRWALRDLKRCSHRHPGGWKCGLEAGHRGRHRYTPQISRKKR